MDDPNERIVPNQCPDKGIINPCWERDCTTEEKKDDLKITDKNILDVLQSMNRRIAYSDKKVRELEQMLQNHIHYIAGTTGKPARREK